MFSFSDYLIMPAIAMPMVAIVAVALDFALGEPRCFHPLVGFGFLANKLAHFNPKAKQSSPTQRFIGLIALLVLILPFIILAYWLCNQFITFFVANTLLLYFAIGHKSLHEHARAVSAALNNNDEDLAKTAASYMVSRDSSAIEPIPATVESVLENGNDGVFGALFWFFIAGGTGALLFRLANTMDAMWGYKTPRFFYFGWAAARFDDALNYIPARLTALTYALLGNTKLALRCWKSQAPTWDSPNAGPVMSSGAGALNVKLGGAARYFGEWHERPVLGADNPPVLNDIERALALVRHGVYIWLGIFSIITLMIASIAHA
ncbi:adenosylcobinamide-phosphate synthase CbiB [Methylotenera sp.]|uniref:adenosylcobinamide-phosphate synthase CbiB n=1 Tax=Methylotenera sp. TaxID=2051956 RepID=UPI002489ADA8|nr:adenosylcobinamide-phosphate synthase CbiB [Methylotenera sp.]MDI1363135.1 adenosylcobinamide-phosphate synthase CbiB [Methylotenera sp.]